MLERLLNLSQKTDIKDPYKKNYNITKNTDMWFVMLPQWSHFLPPFNLARLSSVLLEEGFYTRCLDLNIKSWNYVKNNIELFGYDPWEKGLLYSFKWKSSDLYFKEIHPHLEDIFKTAIETIVKSNPKVVGFTLYTTNLVPTIWFKTELKKRLPNTIFICGGPSTQRIDEILLKEFDIVVVGEAEKIILETLNKIENNTIEKDKFPLRLSQPSFERLDLNLYPIPNYSDFDTNEYLIPNGIVSEFSRGCVAKCTFCEETHFWNYRQRGYLSLVDELEHLNKHFGFNGVWFVDSLLNGNLKELRAFADELIRRKLKIDWIGYARHDRRMDLDYLRTLKNSGLSTFQFGCESGSNKVLDDMKKRVTRDEMEQNFRDCASVGIDSISNWIIGFPTETTNDFVDTMTLIWRNRNTSITNIVVLDRFYVSTQTVISQNLNKFGLLPMNYDNCFIRKDFTLGKPHLLIRSKCFEIFKHELVSKNKISYQTRPNFKKNHYDIEFLNKNLQKSIQFEEFDYNIITTNNPWIDSCVNEPLGIFRFIWRTRGGFKSKIIFEKEIDYNEFGESLSCNLNGYFCFQISEEGEWEFDIDLKYKSPNNGFTKLNDSFFFANNDATLRARKLAKPSWGMGGISMEEYDNINKMIDEYNKTKDLSFHYKNKISGKWKVKTKSLL